MEMPNVVTTHVIMAVMMMPTTTDRLPLEDTADSICPAMTASIMEYPSRMTRLSSTHSFVGHHPIVKRIQTSVRFPDIGPHVAVYATGNEPTMPPNTAHKAASVKPSPYTD